MLFSITMCGCVQMCMLPKPKIKKEFLTHHSQRVTPWLGIISDRRPLAHFSFYNAILGGRLIKSYMIWFLSSQPPLTPLPRCVLYAPAINAPCLFPAFTHVFTLPGVFFYLITELFILYSSGLKLIVTLCETWLWTWIYIQLYRFSTTANIF